MTTTSVNFKRSLRNCAFETHTAAHHGALLSALPSHSKRQTRCLRTVQSLAAEFFPYRGTFHHLVSTILRHAFYRG